uniref:Uncharacterized protein n=1 Tax=Ananas comosus var. bracteatus TaxID=296719 RepID=A0A6V7QQB2_ANACO|nr:unnamed protein product [Ananas comosus var. bracteatus]
MASSKDWFHLPPFIATSFSLFFLLLLLFFLIVNGRRPQLTSLLFNPTPSKNHTSSASNTYQASGSGSGSGSGSSKKRGVEGCNLFDGRWVYDESSPSYPAGSCPFVDSGFNCFRNGRRDLNYTKLRWQPKHCTAPRFLQSPDISSSPFARFDQARREENAGNVEGEKDGIRRGFTEPQHVGITALHVEALLAGQRSRVRGLRKQDFKARSSYSFRFIDYNCSVEFSWSPFLVQPWDSKGKVKETLRLDMIDRASTRYKDADVIIFNSGHWWTHEKTSKGSGDAYRKAMTTWAKWVDEHIDPLRTRVFFRGYAWSHFRMLQCRWMNFFLALRPEFIPMKCLKFWNSGGNCDGETVPITDDKHLAKRYLVLISILESVLAEMRTPVLYLNVTRMTDYRKDGHPSVYRVPAGRRSPETIQDCSHWCLPGVPDAWNELLYAMLLQGLR